MKRQPIDTREWLEDMLCFNGRDADRARELLAILDGRDEETDRLEWFYRQAGSEDPEEIGNWVNERAAMIEAIESDELAAGFSGETYAEHLRAVFAYAARWEATVQQLSELAMDVGLVARNDYKTDPLPLIRMFLPI